MADSQEKLIFHEKCPIPEMLDYRLDDVKCVSIAELSQSVKRSLTDPEYQVCFLGVVENDTSWTDEYDESWSYIRVGFFIYDLSDSKDPILSAQKSVFKAYRRERYDEGYRKDVINNERKEFLENFDFRVLPINTVIQAMNLWLEQKERDGFADIGQLLIARKNLSEIKAILQEQEDYLKQRELYLLRQHDFFAKAS